MNNIHYKNRLFPDAPIVCITTFEHNRAITHGLHIRYYAGEDEKGHKVFNSGSSKDLCNTGNNVKYMYFHEFPAVVPLENFNANIAANDINYYLTTYKTN